MTDRSVRYNFIGNFSSLSAGLSQASRQTRDFAASLTALDARGARMRSGLTQVGQTAGRASLLIGAGLTAAAKAAMDWETAWAGVVKTVDGTSAQLQQLEGDLREMARTLPATHTEIAAVAEAAGQLGVATPDVAEFTRTMIMLGETTNLTADEAATSIARLTNVMGTAPDQVDNLGAALVDLGNNSATTEAEILTLAQRLSAAGSIAGLSESDVLGFAATLSSVGVEAEAGGTALSKVFTTVRDASIDGGKKLETFAKVAGVSAEEFRQAFEDDAAGAIAMFVEGLGRINDAGGSTSQVFKDLGLTDQRLSRALLSTASAGDLLGESLARSAEAYGENTALAEEFAKRQDTTAAQIQVSWNNIKDAGIDAGATLLPVVEKAATAVSGLAKALGALPAPVQTALTGLTGITAVFAGGLWFTSKVVNGITTTRTALSDLGLQGGKTSTVLGKIGRRAAGIAAVAVAMNQLSEALAAAASVNAADISRDLDALVRGDVTDNIDKVIESFGKLDKQGDNLGEGFRNVFSLWGTAGTATWETAAQNIDAVDQQLAALVEAGDEAAAAEIFTAIRVKAAEAGFTLKETGAQFDAYQTALDNAAAATPPVTANTRSLADANADMAKEVRNANDALAERVDAALAAFDAETAWRQAMKNATAQSKKNKAGIEGNSKAALANREALSDLAAKWNGLSEGTRKNVERQKEARKAFIDAAVQMGVNAEKAKRLAERYLDMPEKVETDAEFDASAARREIGVFERELANLDGKVARTTVINTILTRQQRDTGVGGPVNPDAVPRSDGGTVPGRRFPYADRTLILAAPGEEVITNRNGEADRFRADRAAGRIPAYSDGGTVDSYRRAQSAHRPHIIVTAPRSQPHSKLVVTGVLDTPWGPAQVEGVARAAARDEISADKEFAHMLEESRR